MSDSQHAVPAESAMRREIEEIPLAAARLAEPSMQERFHALGEALRALDPPALVTVARGSSDKAATYLKYAIEIVAGRPVASLGPSVASVFGASLRAEGLAVLSISQSGQSPDLVAVTRMLRSGGAWPLALTNSPDSPLGQAAAEILDVRAGPEDAVAATKSFTNSVLAGLWVLAHWQGDDLLMDALGAMPGRLGAGLGHPADALARRIASCDRLVVLGRGPGLGVAEEVALKIIELCAVHASSYSAAEVLHGPATLLTDGFPVLLCGGEPAAQGWNEAVDRLASQGADLLRIPANSSPASSSGAHPLTDPLIDVVTMYCLLERAARLRGRDPDRPALLSKVTTTL